MRINNWPRVSSCLRGLLLISSVTVACAPAAGTTPAGGTNMPASIIDPYLEIQTALADDKTDTIRTSAGNLVTAATALGAPAMKINTAAVALAAAAEAGEPDINQIRDTFGSLSEAIDAYMAGLSLKPGDGVRLAYCPMVKKPWLQKGDTLANPYYGKEMPTCGNFR